MTISPTRLPSQVLVVGVSDEEALGGEGVGLDFDVGARDFVDERGFADVGKSGDQDRSRVRVDRRQAGKMLTHLSSSLLPVECVSKGGRVCV